MKDINSVVIWMPLPPNSNWRGEGIAQTIENIVKHISVEKKIYIVIWKTHVSDLSELVKDKCNITLVPIGLGKKTSKEFIIDGSYIYTDNVFNLLLTKSPIAFKISNKISGYFSQFEYLIFLYLHSYLQRKGLFSKNNCNIWIPTPIIPFTRILKGKKIISFWDPFVFEYKSNYGNTASYLMKKVINNIILADAIITQSLANKDYLVNVMNINADKISVIYNGSPDYSKYLFKFKSKDYNQIWKTDSFESNSKKGSQEKFIIHQLNFSVLWRLLLKNKVAKRKIILISTQDRPYKGFNLILELLNQLSLKNDGYEYIFTCNVPPQLKFLHPILFERIHEITRVSNILHSSLYHFSDLVLHPSNVEGGLGGYPQYEAASMNKPSLINIGRHVYEMENAGVDTSLLAVNFSNFNETIEKIESLVGNENEIEKNIQEISRIKIPWDKAAKQYEEVFFKGY